MCVSHRLNVSNIAWILSSAVAAVLCFSLYEMSLDQGEGTKCRWPRTKAYKREIWGVHNQARPYTFIFSVKTLTFWSSSFSSGLKDGLAKKAELITVF